MQRVDFVQMFIWREPAKICMNDQGLTNFTTIALLENIEMVEI